MKQLVFVFFLIPVYSFAQSNFYSGILPKVNISSKMSDKIKWVNSIETRTFFYEDQFAVSHSLVDISTILSFRTDVNQYLNGGYILRFKDGEIINRLLQHYNYVQDFSNAKLAHRLGFEQFFSSSKPQYRTRYRATFQKALDGQKVDVKEWYVKFSNEYLYQFNKKDLEIRISSYFGYQLSKNEKLEFGLDYRLGQILESFQSNNLWLRATWYITID